ncbi:MAG: DUF4391 domain-containing protein [Acidimicrobiia bacterium]
MTSQVLYRWPAAAKFGRVVPKTRFYERGGVTNAVRRKFVADVQRITWAYKLAEATVHLRGDAAVPEIQVFVVDAKDEDVSDDVLTAIDKAVQFPLIFEINRGAEEQAHTRMVAAYKRLGGAKARTSAYFSTAWQSGDVARVPLPPALELPSLYAALLVPLLPVTPLPGEPLADATERVERKAKLEREIVSLDRRLRKEPQLNRKVELRRQIHACRDELAVVLDPRRPKSKGPQWTS